MSAASLSNERLALKVDVVSIQSQVVYGRVGNNAAIPTLESLGLSVIAVPTVVFSNIPSYPTLHGGTLPIEWFRGYLQDLCARGALDALRAVQIGYLGNPAQAMELCQWLEVLLTKFPDLPVVIDPVLGDQDHGVYSADGMTEVYQQRLTALANGLTPNGFELACLTGLPVNDINAVIVAARTLLKGRTEWVVVTSAAPDTWPTGVMQLVVVTKMHATLITQPHIDVAFAGTGDLFGATLTGHWVSGDLLHEAALKACAHVVHAIRHTERANSRELLLPPVGSRPDQERINTYEISKASGISTSTLLHTRTSP